MPNTFVVETKGLDIRLSVMCGQVFRWKDQGDGQLVGQDGRHWYRINCSDGLADVESNGTVADFRRLFRMDEDWAKNSKFVQDACPEIAPMMDELPGLRLLQPSDPVEVTFSFLCTSNNHLARIYSMVDKLSQFGSQNQFPSLETLALVTEAELRALGFGYRAQTIPKVAQQILANGGTEWLDSLRRSPLESARSALLKLPGVGPKLADCICLYALNHTSAVPVDTHIWQAGCRLWFPEFQGLALTSKRYEMVASQLQDRLGSLAGWAHQFLFYENLKNWRSRK